LEHSSALAPTRFHEISISASRTRLALALFVAFSVLFFGSAKMLHFSANDLVSNLAIVGVSVAIIAMVQAPTFDGRIYGFWTPVQRGDSFGPFVNRNHFAGWMLMALLPTAGLCFGTIARSRPRTVLGIRGFVLWLSSREASRLILTAFATLVMATALVLSMSRSGLVSLILALTIVATAFARHRVSFTRRTIGVLVCLVIVGGAVGWAGPGSVMRHFASASWRDVGHRKEIWDDTIKIIKAFPISGTGLNTYGTAMLFYERGSSKFHYAEAHNDYLQLAAEGGLLVAIPAVCLLIAFVREIRNRFVEQRDECLTLWIRVGAVTGIVAIALQEIVDFSLQMPGNAVLFAVLCAMAIHQPGRPVH
jgi:O-antigen ligase